MDPKLLFFIGKYHSQFISAVVNGFHQLHVLVLQQDYQLIDHDVVAFAQLLQGVVAGSVVVMADTLEDLIDITL